MIGTRPVSVAPGDRSLDRRAGQSGVRRRRDRRMMFGRGMWISWHRIGRIEFRAWMMISVGRWIGQIVWRIERRGTSPCRCRVMSKRLDRSVQVQWLQGRLAGHEMKRCRTSRNRGRSRTRRRRSRYHGRGGTFMLYNFDASLLCNRMDRCDSGRRRDCLCRIMMVMMEMMNRIKMMGMQMFRWRDRPRCDHGRRCFYQR